MDSGKNSFSRMKGRPERGRIAEDLAMEFLIKKGLMLLTRNFRAGHREIDLIMQSRPSADKKGTVHIIEVRSLSEPLLKLPFETVDKSKQKKVISATAKYIYRYNIMLDVQFDIISVTFKADGRSEIEYFPNAFAPEW